MNKEEMFNLVKVICNNNPKQVQNYKSGKKTIIGFLLGVGMRMTRGTCNPHFLKSALENYIESDLK